MKVIDKNELIDAINKSRCEHFDLRDIEQILNKFGNDWLIKDGMWEKVNQDE